jgi:Big-like domain-containing protein
MQSVFRSTFVGVLALAALTACGDKNTTPTPTVTGVTVTPSPATVAVGGRTTLVATVTGTGTFDQTVTWSSGDATIATVDGNGVVTGVAAGTTTIIAASTANPAVKGAASLTVGSGSNIPVTVTISSINQTTAAGSVPANLAAVAGQLDVTLNVDPGTQKLTGVNLIMNCVGNGSKDTVVASETIGSNLVPASDEAAAPVTLSFNTAAFNPTTGAVAFKNGACTMKAQAITAGGTQNATVSQPLTLANVDGDIVTTTTSGATANDANGLPWHAGSITVSATPVLYSGRTPATLTITFPGATTPSQVVPASASGTTTATWSSTASSGPRVTQLTLFGPNDANGFPTGVHPTVLIVDTNGTDLSLGQINPTSQSDLRVDNQSPAAPTLASLSATATGNNNWVTAAYTFTGTGKYVSGGDNSGVGGTTLTVFAAPNNASVPAALTGNVGGILTATGSACTTTGFTAVTSGADLANSTNNAGYVVRILETDKLGNVRCADLSTGGVRTTFGVDKNAPVASITAGPANLAIAKTAAALSNAGTFTVAFQDSLSGFSATPFLVTTTRFDQAAAATCVVGTVVNSVCTPAAQAGGPVSATGGSASDGYYTTHIQVQDQAGNITDLGTIQVLVDNTAPVAVAGVAIPASITANSSQTFSSAFTDNLDLISGEGSVVYPNMTLFFAGSMTPAGTLFDNVLTTSGTSSLTIPAFIIDMQQAQGTNGTPTAAGAKPTNVNVRAVDGAGNFAANAAAIPAANVATATATEFTTAQFDSIAVSNAVSNIKNGTGAATDPTSRALTVTVKGAVSTANNPFTNVCFYYQNTAAGSSNLEWVLIGCQSAAAVTDVGAVRTWTFTSSPFDPPASLGTGTLLNLRAVAMNASGNAISTITNSNITLTN